MNNLDGANFLAQGTLYPDIIKSVSFHGKSNVTIESHHYVFDTKDDAKGLGERAQVNTIGCRA